MNKNNKGVTATEYGLIGALISIVIIGSVILTGGDTKEIFCSVDQAMINSTDDNSDDSSEQGGSSSSSSSVSNSEGYDTATVADLAAQGITASDLSKNDEGLSKFYIGIALGKLNTMLSANGQTITGVEGLYDINGNAITDYATASSLFGGFGTIEAQTAGGTTTDSSGFTDFFELTTSDGQVYEVGNYINGGSTHSAYRNKATGWTGII